MPVLLKLRLPLPTDFGNANPSTQGSRAPKPVILARRAQKMWILLSSRRTSPLVFDRTRNKRFMSKRLPASRLPVGTGQSMATLKEKLIKIGAKVVSRGRYVAFQMAEVAVPRNLFADILRLIAELWPPPAAVST